MEHHYVIYYVYPLFSPQSSSELLQTILNVYAQSQSSLQAVQGMKIMMMINIMFA